MSGSESNQGHLDRYARQTLFPSLGREGQERLLASGVLICGCGALGSVLANTLARAGVGRLRVVDRDFLETNNLQRQVLFDEQDVAADLPKAVAASEKLRRINSEIEVEPVVADLDPTNVLELCRDVDLILDGTDNFETRFLINDVAVRESIPWIFGGCLGTEGQTMSILPGETPCLRCLFQEPPPPGSTPTCDTAGILAPIINVIASIQALEAIKILSGDREAVRRTLLVIELWNHSIREVNLESLKARATCPTCAGKEFPWLDGGRGSHTAVLCGRNAVQLSPPGEFALSLDQLENKLADSGGQITRNRFLLRLAIDGYLLTVFPNGRAIIGGTDDIATARTVYAKFIGM